MKTLRLEVLGCDPFEAFREARALPDLHRLTSRFVRVVHGDYTHTDPHDPTKGQRPQIVMEYCPGETLEKLVKAVSPATRRGWAAFAPP